MKRAYTIPNSYNLNLIQSVSLIIESNNKNTVFKEVYFCPKCGNLQVLINEENKEG
jgi:hypothetical protein